MNTRTNIVLATYCVLLFFIGVQYFLVSQELQRRGVWMQAIDARLDTRLIWIRATDVRLEAIEQAIDGKRAR